VAAFAIIKGIGVVLFHREKGIEKARQKTGFFVAP